MVRGKLKYRDVVGGPKIKSSNQKKYGKQKQRKTDSLYFQSQRQRPHKKRRRYEEQLDEPKRIKREEVVQEIPEPESENEEHEEDAAMQLMALIDPSKYNEMKKALNAKQMKRKVAIESDLEFSDDQEEVEQDKNQYLNKSCEGENESEADSEADEEESKEIEGDTEIDDDVNSEHDPFARHLFYNLHENLLKAVQTEEYEKHHSTWPVLRYLITHLVKTTTGELSGNTKALETVTKFAPIGTAPVRLTSVNLQKLFIKTQIRDNLRKANISLGPNAKEVLTPLQLEMFSIINNYQDFMYNKRTLESAEEIRFVYCLHAVNHILKTRTKILHHNARLSNKDVVDVPDEFRDQGLVRPKILILLPFRDAAYKVVNMISKILLKEDKGNVIKKDRFKQEFTGHELPLPRANPKPEDYVKTLSGNCGDDFMIGITVTKKSLKLYADFYSSDIIIASTLGLRRIVGVKGESHRDFDFLASIELLILDQAEIFLMQNFSYLIDIMKHMHLNPEKTHNTDISRVRHWSINGLAKYYRQTLMFSSIPSWDLEDIFDRYCHNYAGRVLANNPVMSGQIDRISNDVSRRLQYFLKFETTSRVAEIEDRFDFFWNQVLPEFRNDPSMKQTLIYVPNGLEFPKLKFYFSKEGLSYVLIEAESTKDEISTARDKFFHGDVQFLLYSERFHFFNRIKVKGIRHLIFYQPPTSPHFYTEMCNFIREENMRKKDDAFYMTIRVIYSKFDSTYLEGIVGGVEAEKMVISDKKVYTAHKE